MTGNSVEADALEAAQELAPDRKRDWGGGVGERDVSGQFKPLGGIYEQFFELSLWKQELRC